MTSSDAIRRLTAEFRRAHNTYVLVVRASKKWNMLSGTPLHETMKGVVKDAKRERDRLKEELEALAPAAAPSPAAPAAPEPPAPPVPALPPAPPVTQLPDVDAVLQTPTVNRRAWLEQLCARMAHRVACGRVCVPHDAPPWPHGAPMDASATWRETVLPCVEARCGTPGGGSWNDVYFLSAEDVRALGLPGEEAAVVRFTSPKTLLQHDDALLELAFSVLASEQGYGVRVRSASLFLSEWQLAKRSRPDWRLLLFMDRADGTLCKLGDVLNSLAPAQAAVTALRLYEACAKLSNECIFHLDLKTKNVLFEKSGDRIYVIDFDPQYVFHLDAVHPKAAMLVHLVLLAMHLRVSFRKDWRCVEEMIRLLRVPLLQLWRQTLDCAFEGAKVLLQIQMPRRHAESRFPYVKDRERLVGDDKLRKLLPAMCYDYFFDADAEVRSRRATEWPHWRFSTVGGFGHGILYPLLPQLLRFALFAEQPVPPQLEAMLAYEGRER